MENIMIVGVLILVVGAAICYIRKSRKKGVKCIGCPHASACGKSCVDSCQNKEES